MIGQTRNQQLGLTFVEMLAALLVLACLSGLAVPGFSALLDATRMRNQVNNLVSDFHLARQQAWASGLPVVVCPTLDGRACADDRDWHRGVLVFVNTDGDEPPRVDADEPVLRARTGTENPRISANRDAFAINPYGIRSTNGTLTLCSPDGSRIRQVVVSYTGKARTQTPAQVGCNHDSVG